jgi:hypothetical protein
LALVVEAGQHLGGIHAKLHNFKSHAPANRLKLLCQVNGAHTPFADWPNGAIAAEVVITGSRCCIDGQSSAFVRARRTIESA